MKLHPKLTDDVICEAVERRMLTLDNPGFCNACGREHHNCEPDMRRGTCESCGARAVYGADELLFTLPVIRWQTPQ
jgi:hypothetical protein